MNNRFIPSNGVGELYLDVSDMHWYLYESSCYNIDKEIPFMKLLLDMASLRMRYYSELNGNFIELACQDMKSELDKFIDELEKIFQTLFSLIPKNSKFRKNVNKTKLLFKPDLIKQITKFIFKDGKYSSGIYGMIEGIFLRKNTIQIFF